jgi:hypothetical protein
MHLPSKVTSIGKTAHFEDSYLTTPGKRGNALARAILPNCERDYVALKRFFGGLTPKRPRSVPAVRTSARLAHPRLQPPN